MKEKMMNAMQRFSKAMFVHRSGQPIHQRPAAGDPAIFE